MNHDIAALLSQIAEAFAQVGRPSKWPETGYIGYVHVRQGSPREVPDEQVATARLFSGVNWRDLDVHRYVQLSNGYRESFLSFHSHAAFNYYLPAYMLMVLSNGDARQHLLPPLIHALTPNTDSRQIELQKWQADRFSAFSVEQALAIADFLSAAEEMWGKELGLVDSDIGWNGLVAPLQFWRQRTEQLRSDAT